VEAPTPSRSLFNPAPPLPSGLYPSSPNPFKKFHSNSIRLHDRYLKYLTKKFLAKNNIKDYLRVIASDKSSYELKYYKLDEDDEEEEADE
jgi:hypothetical protein